MQFDFEFGIHMTLSAEFTAAKHVGCDVQSIEEVITLKMKVPVLHSMFVVNSSYGLLRNGVMSDTKN